MAAWFQWTARRGRSLISGGVDGLLAVSVAILALGVLYTLYFAAPLLVPIITAALLYQLLDRPVATLNRIGLPLPIAAAAVLFGLLGLIGFGAHFLAEPAEQWLSEAPASIGELRRELMATSGAFDEIRRLGEEIDELASIGDEQDGVPVVQVRGPGHLQSVTGSLPGIVGGLLLTFVTCFFLMIEGDNLGRRLIALGPSRLSRRRISNLLRGVGEQVSTYLTTVTMINVGLGIAVALAMYAIGVPHPALWGVLAGTLNFAPYIGAAISAFVLAVVGVMTFDTLIEALTVPAAYILLSSLEGLVVTPLVLGRRVMLSPLWVFLAVVFWGWMWGVIGALIAVPLTASILVLWDSWQDVDPFRRRTVKALRGKPG
jgi:predicted PurR-regulated permease PerM